MEKAQYEEIKKIAEGAVEKLSDSEAKSKFHVLTEAACRSMDDERYDWQKTIYDHILSSADVALLPGVELNKHIFMIHFWNALSARLGHKED